MNEAASQTGGTKPGASCAVEHAECGRCRLMFIVAMTVATFLIALAIQQLARTYNNTENPVPPPNAAVALAVKFVPEYNPDYFDPDGWGKMGFRVLRGKGLVDEQGRPTAFRGPVVPAVFAAAMALFGESYDTLLYVQALFYALGAGVVGLVAGRIFTNRWVPPLTMLIYLAFVPAHPWFCHIFAEPIYTFLVAVFLLLWMISLEKTCFGWSLAAGLAFILAALARPILYYFLPFALLLEWRQRGWNRKTLVSVSAFLLGFALLEVPWIVRNYMVVERFVPTTTGSAQAYFGMTWYQEANWMGNPYHDPERFPPKAEGFWDLPKVEREKRFREMALENLRSDPVAVLMLIPRRALMFLFQMRPRGWIPTAKSMVVGGALYLLAVAGYVLMSAGQRWSYRPCLWLFVFSLAFHSIVGAEYRYSHPVQPYVFMLSAFGLWTLLRRGTMMLVPEVRSKGVVSSSGAPSS